MAVIANILSMNIGGPEEMSWNGKSILSSMLKRPFRGPLVVNSDGIEGNRFANPSVHGSVDAVLYIYGISSAESFVRLLGQSNYDPGSTGETLTVDHFDETDISVGDTFSIGQVIAQATYPRIPCAKVNFRMQHELGQKSMQDCGRSGVYLRILKAGLIYANDQVVRTVKAEHTFMISRMYELIVKNQKPTIEELEAAKRNPAFVAKQVAKWERP